MLRCKLVLQRIYIDKCRCGCLPRPSTSASNVRSCPVPIPIVVNAGAEAGARAPFVPKFPHIAAAAAFLLVSNLRGATVRVTVARTSVVAGAIAFLGPMLKMALLFPVWRHLLSLSSMILGVGLSLPTVGDGMC